MVTFYTNGEATYRVLIEDEAGVWAIQSDGKTAPRYISSAALDSMTKVAVDTMLVPIALTKKQEAQVEKRRSIIEPLIKSEEYISSRAKRLTIATEIASENKISVRTVLRFYYSYLAKGTAGLAPVQRKTEHNEKTPDQKIMEKALNQYFYSANRMNLRMAYEMMLIDYYRTEGGILQEEHPSFNQFRYYFRKHRNMKKEAVARKGIGDYQKNQRPLTGAGDSGIDKLGTYEMDATLADIYLVSRYDRKPIGRPYIYMAIDVASRLIAGIYVGLDAGSTAVLSCIANAVSDKVEFCNQYGIHIAKNQWPAEGLPNRIVTDRGKEFACDAILSLCETYRMEIVGLPPYRPDLKGYIEKAFDCLQNRYKPLLHGKGVIEENTTANGAPDYYKQASLDIVEFTRVVIEAVLYYNAYNILNDCTRTPAMVEDNVEPFAADVWQWCVSHDKVELTWIDGETTRLLLLPRAKAQMTRYGLKFNWLFYTNPQFEQHFVKSARGQTVTIAYDENDNRIVYLVKDGTYTPFTLTLASQKYDGLSLREMSVLMETEKETVKQAKGRQTMGSLQCNERIISIRENAGQQKHSTEDIKKEAVQQRRRKEKDYE